MDAVTFQQISCSFGNRTIARELSFSLAVGRKTVIYGPSGTGKSTLLKFITGFLRPDSGTVRVFGAPPSPRRRLDLAMLEQNAVMGAETIRETLFLPFTFRANRNLTPDEPQMREALTQVNLADRDFNAKTASLSGGEKQRLAIARMLLLKRRLILADEFTSAQDSDNRRTLVDLLLKHQATVLAVSHDDDVIAAFPCRCKLENGVLSYES